MSALWQAVLQPKFLDDLEHWVLNDPRTAKRLLELMRAILRDPCSGIGKPDLLQYLGSGVWSRRITQEHRCVYLVGDGRVEFLQALYHY